MHIWPSSWQKLSLNGWKWKPERIFILMFSSCPENNTIDQSMDNHMVLLLHHGMKTFVSLFPSYLASLFHVSYIWNKSHRNLGGSVRWAKISPEWNSYWTESKLHPVNGKEKSYRLLCNGPSFLAASAPLSWVAQPSHYSSTENAKKKRNPLPIQFF